MLQSVGLEPDRFLLMVLLLCSGFSILGREIGLSEGMLEVPVGELVVDGLGASAQQLEMVIDRGVVHTK